MRLRLHPAAAAELDEAVTCMKLDHVDHVGGEQIVVAVAHTSREPKYRRGRLEDPRNTRA